LLRLSGGLETETGKRFDGSSDFSEPACMSRREPWRLGLLLHELTGSFRNFQVLSLVNASVTGAKASLTVFSTELVSWSWGLSISGLSYGLTRPDWPGEIVVP